MSVGDLSALIIVTILWALCYPLITVGLGFAPPLSFAALRALLAGTALALTAWAFRRPMPRTLRAWAMLMAIGAGTTSLGFFGMFDASEFVSPGLATVIANIQPLLAAILARLCLGERLARTQRFGLLLGFTGIIIISLPHFGGAARAGFTVGIAYIMLAASGVAVGNVFMKGLVGQIDPLTGMAAQTLFGAVPLLIGAILREHPSTILWSPAFAASLLGLALLGTALAYWLWFRLLERIPLSRANAFTFLTPVVGFGFGMAFFGERPGVAAAIGLPLAAAGVVLAQRSDGAARP